MMMKIITFLLCCAFVLGKVVSLTDHPKILGYPHRYFKFPPHSSHLDTRFARSKQLTTEEKHEALVKLVRWFLTNMRDLKVQPWLAHGALLGWHYGGKIMPWDDDVDVHIHYQDLLFLAAYHNMTVSLVKTGKHSKSEYLLDINPNHGQRSRKKDPDNMVDARYIDMATGLFVDITAVDEVQAKGTWHLLAKDGHHYLQEDVLPLQNSTFEGEEVYVPKNAKLLLSHEYGDGSLNQTIYIG
jgi:phosphorylcholine metabolism protein LicD